MSLTVLEAKNKLQPYILRYVPKESAEWIFDSEFIDILNSVANDLNRMTAMHIERYTLKTVEDINYYEMAGDISKMLLFMYYDSGWEEQQYAILRVSGTPFKSLIVLKSTPDAEIEMDIRYTRQVLEVTDTDSDEIDIPDRFLTDFLDLVKAKIRVEFGNAPLIEYDGYLELKSKQVGRGLDPYGAAEGIRRWWPFEGANKDESLYDITAFRVSDDHVIVGSGPTYTWTE